MVVVGLARYTTIKIAPNIQHMLWFAGLRGAMAYACSKQVRGTRSSHTGCAGCEKEGREGRRAVEIGDGHLPASHGLRSPTAACMDGACVCVPVP